MMILLTGVTGKTGSVAAQVLAKKGFALRALVRNEEKAVPLKEAGIELIIGDINDPAAVAKALEGAEKALMITPNGEQQQALEKSFVDAALKAGVKHVVKLSSGEASPEATAPIPRAHYECEEYIKQSGLTWTMVRPNFFMQNFLANVPTISEQQKFFLPMGDAKAAMNDTRDIGEAMAVVLSEAGHENKSYDVTGPELLSFHDAAAIFSEVLGTTITYVNTPPDSYRETLAKVIPSEWHVNAVCELFAEIAAGGLEHKTNTLKELLGREPRSFKKFAGDYAAAFKS